jgi:V-type H+-transporting ATPase subunit B
MKAVVGEEALTEEDKLFLQFHDRYEQEFVNQGYYENRTIFDSLDRAWSLLSLFSKEKLTKISKDVRDEFYMRVKREFDEERNGNKTNKLDDKSGDKK